MHLSHTFSSRSPSSCDTDCKTFWSNCYSGDELRSAACVEVLFILLLFFFFPLWSCCPLCLVPSVSVIVSCWLEMRGKSVSACVREQSLVNSVWGRRSLIMKRSHNTTHNTKGCTPARTEESACKCKSSWCRDTRRVLVVSLSLSLSRKEFHFHARKCNASKTFAKFNLT